MVVSGVGRDVSVATSGLVTVVGGAIGMILGLRGQRVAGVGARFADRDGRQDGVRLASKRVREGSPGIELAPNETIGVAAHEG